MRQMKSAASVFCVNDMDAAISCLRDQLGFVLANSVDDPPSWASLMRDNVEIMVLQGDYPKPPQDWAAYIYVEDADNLHDEFVSRGADIVAPLENKPYNIREFVVRLPDGRQIAFGADCA